MKYNSLLQTSVYAANFNHYTNWVRYGVWVWNLINVLSSHCFPVQSKMSLKCPFIENQWYPASWVLDCYMHGNVPSVKVLKPWYLNQKMPGVLIQGEGIQMFSLSLTGCSSISVWFTFYVIERKCFILLIQMVWCMFLILGNKCQWQLNENTKIFINENAFENVWKMAALLSCLLYINAQIVVL